MEMIDEGEVENGEKKDDLSIMEVRSEIEIKYDETITDINEDCC